MSIFQVYFGFKNNQGRPIYWTIEHAAETVEALSIELEQKRFILATRLWTEADGRGERKIIGRDTVIIGIADLGAIQLAAVKHWDPSAETSPC